MFRWPSLVFGALSLSITSWSLVASAQTEGAPLPDPAQPPPAPAAPTPPSDPVLTTPPSEATPPSAEPAPPSQPPPPPSGAFPLPPPSSGALEPANPPPGTRPPATRTAAPVAVAPPRTDPAAPTRPSDGLFEQRAPSDQAHHHDDKEGTDQFKIGPVVGVGVPSIISFGGTMKLTRFLGAGINVGLIPKVQLNYYGDATLSYQHYDIYGRIYPFGGGFFLSGGAGYATVKGTLDSTETRSITVAGVGNASATATYTGSGSVRTLMLTALIGYFYTTSVGFSIGVDAGAQIPLAPSQIEFSRTFGVKTTPTGFEQQATTFSDPYLTKSDKSVHDSLEKIGRTVLPTLNLRIGWIL
jgi:hypothetical protein